MSNRRTATQALFLACPIALVMGLASMAQAAVIVQYDFTAGSLAASTEDPLVTSTAVANTGLSGFVATNNELQVSDSNISFNVATDFVSFTVTADLGYNLDLTNLTFSSRIYSQPGSRNANLVVRTSADSFASDLTISPGNLVSSGSNSTFTVDLSSLAPLNEITIRLYTIRAQSLNYRSTYDNVTLNGELAVIPEPATLGLIAAGGLLLAGRRRR